MKVTILGTGEVGLALATGFATLGHDTKFGTRDPGKQELQDFISKTPNVSADTNAAATAWGEIIVFAAKWTAAEEVVKLAGVENFAGKIIIDATNPIIPGAWPPALSIGHTDSAGETLQRWLPQSHVVKAFNVVGNREMFRPQFADGTPDMFICGNDAAAKTKVTEILKDFGWPTIDVGKIEASRSLEQVCILWCLCGIARGEWRQAFKLLRK